MNWTVNGFGQSSVNLQSEFKKAILCKIFLKLLDYKRF